MWPNEQMRAPGMAAITAASASAMKSGMAETNTEGVIAVRPPSGFCAGDMFSRMCQSAARCSSLEATTAFRRGPVSMPSAAALHHARRRVGRIRGRDIDEVRTSHGGWQAVTHAENVARGEIHAEARHRSNPVSAGPQRLDARSNSAGASATDFSPAKATSWPSGQKDFSTAPVMTRRAYPPHR